ncbi:AMP-binding protein [Mycobacterium sp.]|uniref:AMP-binding protein n=1 Tax=Mycobacterium sp. TaxID=1785 RepID=UPI002D9E318B|nr:AMP-binding protein [Mycobacterium sp.]
MSNPSTAILDIPFGETPDPHEFLQAAMQWHFSPDTGSPFWLKHGESLDFDPRRDVKEFTDLSLFPNVTNELRDVAVRDLIPQGYGPTPPIAGVFESGGTTGAPKRVVFLQDWMDQMTATISTQLDAVGVPHDVDWLAITPTGPHGIGQFMGAVAALRGGIRFSIDMDPRWVKKLIADGKFDGARAYSAHLIEQSSYILQTQEIGVLVATPPLLAQIAEVEQLAELVRRQVKVILWGGTRFDPDTADILRTEVFPEIPLYGFFGNTMTLGSFTERIGDNDLCIFDPIAPWLSFRVVNPDTKEPVALGERGQVVMNHVSKSFLLPNNLERDMATRIQAPDGAVGDSIADVGPVVAFDNETVIEGVY